MKNILLADDVPGWLTFHKSNLEKIFKDTEVNFFAFGSATDAYDFALSFKDKIDLVITDLQMEPMEQLAGEWLVENLKTIKSTSLSKYIIVSSCWNIALIAERTGADGHLRKAEYQADSSLLKLLVKELFGEKL